MGGACGSYGGEERCVEGFGVCPGVFPLAWVHVYFGMPSPAHFKTQICEAICNAFSFFFLS
jgi:hypothetical protein